VEYEDVEREGKGERLCNKKMHAAMRRLFIDEMTKTRGGFVTQ